MERMKESIFFSLRASGQCIEGKFRNSSITLPFIHKPPLSQPNRYFSSLVPKSRQKWLWPFPFTTNDLEAQGSEHLELQWKYNLSPCLRFGRHKNRLSREDATRFEAVKPVAKSWLKRPFTNVLRSSAAAELASRSPISTRTASAAAVGWASSSRARYAWQRWSRVSCSRATRSNWLWRDAAGTAATILTKTATTAPKTNWS
ncbi:unnamed protein product [Prunus armeniaca]